MVLDEQVGAEAQEEDGCQLLGVIPENVDVEDDPHDERIGRTGLASREIRDNIG